MHFVFLPLIATAGALCGVFCFGREKRPETIATAAPG